jgi:predicted CXXCH cytochrome family protein
MVVADSSEPQPRKINPCRKSDFRLALQISVMFSILSVLVIFLLALVLVLQISRAVGLWRAVVAGAVGLLVVGSAWGALEWNWRAAPPLPKDLTSLPPVTSETCAKCHQSHYDSWHRTFHRTMTRDATAENVKGDFNNAVMKYGGFEAHMTQRDNRFFVDVVDPRWESQFRTKGVSLEDAGPVGRLKISVDRVVGSHWLQQAFHYSPNSGRYIRLPLVYHIVENRWIHVNGAFLTPNEPDDFVFPKKGALWNASCLYCHNTRPAGNPIQIPNDDMPGYKSTVGELGISCEACHGASERHVQDHQNPARRLAQIASGAADPTIANPARLSIPRADEVCGRCHGAPLARYSAWNQKTLADPYLAGKELKQTWRTCWSEAEMDEHATGEQIDRGRKVGQIDGRFWSDGTPLTTALEYQGMSLSACYQDGKGQLSCLTCHSMHQSDPNHQLKEGMRTNEACYRCHETYRTQLAEHTHHAADSSGSLCMNCHMPQHVYSLLDTHRSHRIMIPRVRESVDTGKPHACNLCHLDKSLGWTSNQLQKWYGTKPETLSEADRTIASSVLHLLRGDARSRAIVAGAFSDPDAHKASGRDWPGLLLTRALQPERYEAIRYLLHRALRSLYGKSVEDYNFQGLPAERTAQISTLERFLEQGPRPDRQTYPELPLTEQGRLDDIVNRWLKNRSDPDVRIKE